MNQANNNRYGTLQFILTCNAAEPFHHVLLSTDCSINTLWSRFASALNILPTASIVVAMAMILAACGVAPSILVGPGDPALDSAKVEVLVLHSGERIEFDERGGIVIRTDSIATVVGINKKTRNHEAINLAAVRILSVVKSESQTVRIRERSTLERTWMTVLSVPIVILAVFLAILYASGANRGM